MKILRPFVLLVGVLCTLTLTAQDFEGRIKMQIKDGRETLEIETATKKDFARVELPGQGTSISTIVNLPRQEMIMLMPGQKMYMVMPLQQPAADAKSARDEATLEKTDETETILGYKCTKYLARDGEAVHEIWAAEGLGTFAGLGTSNPIRPGNRSGWEDSLMKNGFFPLRVVGLDRRGRETFRMEVVSIEKESLPASLFEIPEGYQRFEMGGLGGMLKGAIPKLPFGGGR